MRLVPYSNVMKFDYEPMPAWGRHDNRIWFRCECGALQFIDDWEIDMNGNVTPSIDHSSDPGYPCTFHDFVQLQDYADHINKPD